MTVESVMLSTYSGPSSWIFVQRGWTTWTTGAVDKRVIGMVPIVEDALNLVKVRLVY